MLVEALSGAQASPLRPVFEWSLKTYMPGAATSAPRPRSASGPRYLK